MTTPLGEKLAEKYLEVRPFTLAGFNPLEVKLIYSAYREAFLAGWAARGEKDKDIVYLLVGDGTLAAMKAFEILDKIRALDSPPDAPPFKRGKRLPYEGPNNDYDLPEEPGSEGVI